MNQRPLNPAALIELLIAASLWGFGFVATVWALQELGPLAISGLRFVLAAGVGGIICLIVPSLRRQIKKSQFMLAFWPGMFLATTLVLQTWGLRYTTATKSGFITTLYILVVPVMERILLSRRIPKYHLVFVLLALVGVGMICDIQQMFFTPVASENSVAHAKELWNIGDWLTLSCMVAASLQIVWFGKIADQIESSFAFNVYQCLWAAPVPLALAFAFENVTLNLSPTPMLGLGMLAFGSSLIAFALQVKAQKSIAPSLASLLYLLESPIAALFGVLLLGERLTVENGVGCAVILIALATSVVFEQPQQA